VIRGQLEFGILQLPAGKRRERLEKWFAASIASMNCLSLTVDTSETWARLLAKLRKAGNAMPIKDSLIAASALTHELTVVTRNVHDFKNAGVKVIDPF
jgi:predicted nucleic acid-binding protein